MENFDIKKVVEMLQEEYYIPKLKEKVENFSNVVYIICTVYIIWKEKR